MAKLYFKYGTMGSGKSIDLIKTNFNYIENGKKTICFTSNKDNRYDKGKITTRLGISIDAITVYDHTNIYNIIENMSNISCIFFDEVQFITKKQVFQLSDIVDFLDIPVICYGLRSDFKMDVFESSKYLMGISDHIDEIKTMCRYCSLKKAIVNVRFRDNEIEKIGEQIQIGGNETYKPLCRKCYKHLLDI